MNLFYITLQLFVKRRREITSILLYFKELLGAWVWQQTINCNLGCLNSFTATNGWISKRDNDVRPSRYKSCLPLSFVEEAIMFCKFHSLSKHLREEFRTKQ